MPMRTGDSFAIQGIRSCRDKRLRYTTLPVLSIPTACNTRLAISIPRTFISCFIGLSSCGSIGSLIMNSLWLIAVNPHRGGSISLRPITAALTFVGLLYRRQGDVHRAIAALERGLALSQTANILMLFPLAASSLGAAYALAGRVAEALPLLDQMRERVVTGGRTPYQSLALAELSEA